jgi:hypothetical protein
MTAELAHSFTMGLCEDPHCTALHFALERRNGEHFATMTIAVENVPKVIKAIQDLAYGIEVTRKDY